MPTWPAIARITCAARMATPSSRAWHRSCRVGAAGGGGVERGSFGKLLERAQGGGPFDGGAGVIDPAVERVGDLPADLPGERRPQPRRRPAPALTPPHT